MKRDETLQWEKPRVSAVPASWPLLLLWGPVASAVSDSVTTSLKMHLLTLTATGLTTKSFYHFIIIFNILDSIINFFRLGTAMES